MRTQVAQARRQRAVQLTPLAMAMAGLCASSAVLAQEKKADGTDQNGNVVIVTGVMAQTRAKDANISYNVLNKEDLERFTPISGSDLLRDLPGVNVESNDGVARNEVYTRGMSVGSGGGTFGNFWSSILEDGLPVLPSKFSGFQDSNFYRPDISTSRVESVRGGSTGTTVGSSVGGAFNYLSGAVKPGASIQTRLGFEGDDYHASWKEVDAYYGWVNEAGDRGFNVSGFTRRSNGSANPGYDLNHGGQIKSNFFKNYETAGGGRGTVKLTLKHLDDTNAAMVNNFVPTYGYANPQIVPGFGRNTDLFVHGGQHDVPTDSNGGSIFHDPQDGYRYKQDAVWLKWEHDTGGPWSFSAAAKGQLSQTLAAQSAWKGLYSLWNTTVFQDQFNVNQAAKPNQAQNLNNQAGTYELYDIATGQVRARIANNVGTSVGTDYRTGAACAKGAAGSPAQCVTYTDLPTRTYDLRGGVVNGVTIPADSYTANTDQVLALKAELGKRSSRDTMVDLQGNYSGDSFKVNFGLFAVKVNQQYISYGNGFALAPFADHQVTPLGVRFVTQNGTKYQLTDSGGWGRLGSGFGSFRYFNKERDISPYGGGSWQITDHWDVNGSVKATYSNFKTHTENWVQNAASYSATSRTAGGLDGNAQTWYDNAYTVPPAAGVDADRSIRLLSYSGSVGYTFNERHKVYFRFSSAQNNISNVPTKWTTPQAVVAPFSPQAEMVNQEIAYNFSGRGLSGQVTYWRMKSAFPFNQSGTNVDGTVYYTDEIRNHYLTNGIEAWAKWQATKNLSWQTSATYATGKTLNETSYNFGSPGPQDDTIKVVSGTNIPKLAKWMTSNTVTYKLGDFWFNLRHRWMSSRRTSADPADPRVLPIQRNLDLSIQYTAIRDTRVSLEVRNVLNNMYISQYDTLLPTATGVSKIDIYNQLPNSATWIKVNQSRSFWLTIKHDF